MATTQAQQYSDPVIKKYADLIKSKTSAFRAIYFGDPIRVPTSKLPALIIAKRSSGISYITNAEDRHDVQLVFTVITDLRKDISDDTSIVAGISTLYDLIEGRDPNTLVLKPESLLSILRHNVDLNQNVQLYTDVSVPTKVDYGMTMGKRMEDHWGIEGTLTITATLVQLR